MAKETSLPVANDLSVRGGSVNGTTDEAIPVSALLPVAHPTQPFWLTDLHKLNDSKSSDELPAECAVLIIGAGYAGVATAYNLVKGNTVCDAPIPSVTILEARSVCSGATGRNGE